MGCGREGSVGSRHSSGCVCEVVQAILDIQNQAVRDDCSSCTTNCFLEPLGGIVSPARKSADTRVFTLSTKTGVPFLASFTSSEENYCNYCFSIYFRVEDVFDDCCATLRVLIPLDESGNVVDLLNEDGTKLALGNVCEVVDFAASESCITVDLNCFCAVQCIADVDLEICN
ncbi:CotY/CotZ family spore coat protein [Lysinibacillus sp. 54212]|uniref:CotY/CotZ family spore coat protein n=1 Tax=Lysinibacillus sp. 54212 TaxID=3119829 RepID=UPI002FC85559